MRVSEGVSKTAVCSNNTLKCAYTSTNTQQTPYVFELQQSSLPPDGVRAFHKSARHLFATSALSTMLLPLLQRERGIHSRAWCSATNMHVRRVLSQRFCCLETSVSRRFFWLHHRVNVRVSRYFPPSRSVVPRVQRSSCGPVHRRRTMRVSGDI